jgi:hypothetical protein
MALVRKHYETTVWTVKSSGQLEEKNTSSISLELEKAVNPCLLASPSIGFVKTATDR